MRRQFLKCSLCCTGIEGKMNRDHDYYSLDGPLIKDSVIVSETGVSTGCTHNGIILPFSGGFMIR